MQLSIIIVNYKSAKYIEQLLRSVQQYPLSIQAEWIIVDNDSKDGSRELLTEQFPFIIWQDMGYNAGFARANNRGMQVARGDCFLLLNPDTIAIDDSISRTYHKLRESNYVAAGIQLVHQDGTDQMSGSFFVKGGLNHLLPIPYWGKLIRTVAFALKAKRPHVLSAAKEEKVDWISGAFLMVKKTAVGQAGYMNEDFFLYGEEVEWCYRLNKCGALCLFGDFSMIHLIGETITAETGSSDKEYTNLFDKKGRQLILSNHLRIRKQYGIGWLMVQLLNYTIGIPVYLFVGIISNVVSFKKPLLHWHKWVGYTLNVLEVWKHLPLLVTNKQHFYKVI